MTFRLPGADSRAWLARPRPGNPRLSARWRC